LLYVSLVLEVWGVHTVGQLGLDLQLALVICTSSPSNERAHTFAMMAGVEKLIVQDGDL
jgi:hypothetical protein